MEKNAQRLFHSSHVFLTCSFLRRKFLEDSIKGSTETDNPEDLVL